ncbi:type II toxin-antitoxin system RelE/ParE family toxin [Corynebacterium nuruki]|uniref:type II toxin-antitoxin system RelE/ParE family toxin n=1 Tax=Corynebacterium nuruki TaxID=1032851 RepID=UPI0039BED244
MIQSFADRTTGELWRNLNSRKLDSRIVRPALRKLRQLNGAAVLDDLRVPPGNRLEALHGDRRGQHSIRVNSQWRICFTWTPAGPADVQIVDYH